MNTHTPKHFVLQLGALLALYTTLVALITLLFSVINLAFPDAADYYYNIVSANTTIRTMIAILVVFFPAFLTLSHYANKFRTAELGGAYTTIARWLIYLSLLTAGGVMLGDLVTLINYFLNGEITTRFLLKVFVLFAVVGATFHYYLLDVREFFLKRPDKRVAFAVGAIVVVIASLAFGFRYTDAPAVVREARIDEQQVSDLQMIQSYIESYYYNTNTLPDSIATAYGDLTYPTAPEGRTNYRYELIDSEHYQLCATFGASTQVDGRSTMAIAPEKNYNWDHEVGDWCFERSITSAVPVKSE